MPVTLWLASAVSVAACMQGADAAQVAQPPRQSTRLRRSAQSLSLAQTRLGGAEPRSYKVTKLRTIPHVDKPWTQGLEFSDDGRLIETSGDYPEAEGNHVSCVLCLVLMYIV